MRSEIICLIGAHSVNKASSAVNELLPPERRVVPIKRLLWSTDVSAVSLVSPSLWGSVISAKQSRPVTGIRGCEDVNDVEMEMSVCSQHWSAHEDWWWEWMCWSVFPHSCVHLLSCAPSLIHYHGKTRWWRVAGDSCGLRLSRRL